ncbi:MAG: hypothetical protein ACI7YS_11625 [Flavobacterium sp.]
MENPSKETLEQWRKDPKNWRWGVFYYNKEDKRLLPPKKNPDYGWTVNFANRKSVLFFFSFLMFFILIFYLMVIYGK